MLVSGLLHLSLALGIAASGGAVTVEPVHNSTEAEISAVLETALAIVPESTTSALGHIRAKRQWGGFGCCAPIPPPMVCCQPMLPPIPPPIPPPCCQPMIPPMPPPMPPPCCMPVIPPPIVSCCGCCMPVCMPMCMRGGCGMGGCGMGFGFGRKKRALIAMRPNDTLKHFL
uniref:IGFBP N-terminal domain-containing protein n=1 Tax=Steinernema glaseri TaxID=37863 RepID=A0A1I8ATT9_9BILA